MFFICSVQPPSFLVMSRRMRVAQVDSTRLMLRFPPGAEPSPEQLEST
jgi:hypothetical protein